MVFKFCILAALATVASCGHASSSAYVKAAPSHGHPLASYGSYGHGAESYGSYGHGAKSYGSYGHGAESYGSYGHESYHNAHPSYKFAYNVHDPHTHDVKAQEETRDGHHVKGFYSLYEADGSKRVVHYADNGHGFEATVHKEGGHHPVSAPVHYAQAPAYHAAPVYEKY
ncbi:unnamed protein product [Bemisia tabaci]|uniref:Cuticular protein n=1 Tax=Bemisia tabaci TaxID=7038 RepID=A0A9P0F902_BEMTA|nr:PREDICTED: cuticle protein 7-like [Bemisia tabaci]CAH0393053.1 unnamed protein product [Bemisia tabaci]